MVPEGNYAIGSVTRRNGAYMASMHGMASQGTEDAGPEELYNCAGSLRVAKAVLVDMARGFGFTGSPRWEQVDARRWDLRMTGPHPDEDDDEPHWYRPIGGES